jgi:hypothetical protein
MGSLERNTCTRARLPPSRIFERRSDSRNVRRASTITTGTSSSAWATISPPVLNGKLVTTASTPTRRLGLKQEVDLGRTVGAAVVDQVARDDRRADSAEFPNDRAGARGGLPDGAGNLFDPEQRLHGDRGRLVTIVPTIGERMFLPHHGRVSSIMRHV